MLRGSSTLVTVLLLVASLGLAGCLEDAPRGAIETGEQASWSHRDGLNLTTTSDRGSLGTGGEEATFTLIVTNEGDRAVHYRKGCMHEWDVAILHEGEEVTWHEPMAMCQGFEPSTLDPGAEETTSFPWNGTLWNGSAYVPADPGTYVVRGVFVYQHEEDGEDRRLVNDLAVEVEDG